ncbi:unnamed protein product, partial [Mesorhabditis spiculigera]
MICSSSAHKPEVRIVDVSRLEDKSEPQTIIGLCAPDREMNTTAVLVEYGNPACPNGGDDSWLNEPQFVGSFDVGDYVYFFFREVANEASRDMKRIYSRVARICKKDLGGKTVMRQVWTSYVKARLNCSLPGDIPVSFDHIQSVAKAEFEGETMFYAGMSSSDTAFVSSAICVFQLRDIDHIFDHGLFADDQGGVGADPNTGHRPGTCVPDSPSLDPEALNFVRSHLLMKDPISSQTPIFTQRDAVFHHLLVDSRQEHNVVFAIDAPSSRLWRLAHWRDGSDWRLETIESASVLSPVGGVQGSALLPGEFLYLTSRNGVAQFTPGACGQWKACQPCAIDPYCSWNVARAQCHPREKLHHQSPGWVSSWAGRGAPECKTVGRPVLTKAFPGDAVHLETQPGSVWLRDGVRIESGPRTAFTSESGLVLFDVAKKDNGDYEAVVDGRQIVKYRLIVDHEDCEQPKTIESLKAAQRQYCKRMDGHKRAMADWHSQKQQCPITQNVSGNPLR